MLLVLLSQVIVAQAQTTTNAVTWQGKLMYQGQPYNGEVWGETWFFDDEEGGNPIGFDQPFATIVEDGLLQLVVKPNVDFHAAAAWLEIRIGTANDVELTTLTPRQMITTVPMAMTAFTARRALEPFNHSPMSGHLEYLFYDHQFRFHPAGSGVNAAPNLIIGSGVNSVSGIGSGILSGGHLQNPNELTGNHSVIAGGRANLINGNSVAIGGGENNQAWSLASTVSGGLTNMASDAYAVVGGGLQNTASAQYSTAAGGHLNCAGGHYSWAGGRRAKVRPGFNSGFPGQGCAGVPINQDQDRGDQGTFIWADSQNSNFVSSGENQFLVRAAGGVGFGRAPSDYFVIDSDRLVQDDDYSFGTGALRVLMREANNSVTTKFRIMGNGGTAIGNSYSGSGVPANGLRVFGDARFDNDSSVHGDLRIFGDARFDNNSRVYGNLRVDGQIEAWNIGTFGQWDLCHTNAGQISRCASSARFKDEVRDLQSGSELIAALRPVRFRWIEADRQDIGLIAEEVAEVIPELIEYDADGEVQGVNFRHLSAVLVAAVQESQAENKLLREQLEVAQARLDALETRMDKLLFAE